MSINAQQHHIIGRMKVPPMGIAKWRDLWTIPTGMTSLVMDDTITPYCLHNDDVVLVETTADVALAGQAFLYRQQYRHAKRLYTVPQLTFCERMSQRDNQHAPIFICGMGRSGSTLLAQMLNVPSQTLVYDEPDVYTQMAGSQVDNALVLAITNTFTRDSHRLVLKQRSFVSYMIPQLHATFPDARFLFLYRDPVAWVQSNLRLVLRYRIPEFTVRRLLHSMIAPYLTEDELSHVSNMSMIQIATRLWMKFMHLAQTLITDNVPILPLHYDDFIATPQSSLEHVLDWCHLPSNDLDAMLAVRDHDSQRDTPLARDKMSQLLLSPEQVQQITDFIERDGWSHDSRLPLPSERITA
ncbi:MAG: sulfotransferase [Chloroflexota bacterium]